METLSVVKIFFLASNFQATMDDFRLCLVVEVMMKSTLKELNMDEVCLFVPGSRPGRASCCLRPATSFVQTGIQCCIIDRYKSIVEIISK